MTSNHTTHGGSHRRAPIRVLIIEAHAAQRELLTTVLAHESGLEVVGSLDHGGDVIEEIRRSRPDLVTLSEELPDVDGMSVLRDICRTDPTLPVIVMSAIDERHAALTIDALAVGAADHVTSPSGIESPHRAAELIRATLVPRIKAICGAFDRGEVRTPAAPATTAARRPEVVAIGASTGGPSALTTLLATLPAEFDRPLLITQHMPPLFTRYLAERLDDASPLLVREARHGDVVEPGVALVAPGDVHLAVERTAHGIAVVLEHTPPVQFNRPSIDVMLRGVTTVYGGDAVAVILSGMGRDGVEGCRSLHGLGGTVLVQDPASSLVWEMPGAVHAAGAADAVVPIDQLADAIVDVTRYSHISVRR